MEEVQKIPDTVLNSLPGIREHRLHCKCEPLQACEAKCCSMHWKSGGVQVSSGSACSSNKTSGQSGIKRNWSEKICWILPCGSVSVRIQQKKSWNTRLQELKELLVVLRRYSRH